MGTGCPACAEYGFNPDQPAIVYYFRIPDHRGGFAYKIGITNRTVRERFGGDYQRLTVLKVWSFRTGAKAYAFEQSILQQYGSQRFRGPRLLRTAGNAEIFASDVLGLDTRRRAA